MRCSSNGHIDSRRQWVMKTYALWAGELAFIESLLVADLRNNSAWNHRHLVVRSAPRALMLAQLCPEEISSEENSAAESNAIVSNSGDSNNFADARIRAHEER